MSSAFLSGKAVVVGAGPAGLMAADRLATAGLPVVVADHKPSVGRKLLMAGKSGLNLTKEESPQQFLKAYAEAGPWLAPMLEVFGPGEIRSWSEDLGQDVFTGSTGRVFPKAMKASPLLRAWLVRLEAKGVDFRTRWRWTGWQGDAICFETPDGVQTGHPSVTVLAMGGASWARLGSDGAWTAATDAAEIARSEFQPSNVGVSVPWSGHMERFFGQPLKGVALSCGDLQSRGECVISAKGLEGGGIYALSRSLRGNAELRVDLVPDLDAREVETRLQKPRGKSSLSNVLRKSLRLDPVRIALLHEFARPLPRDPEALTRLIKGLRVDFTGLRPLDEAISVAGGISRNALTAGLMLVDRPGVFAAGEMLDWDAPTGGYLLTACLSTGRWAGDHAAEWASSQADNAR